MLKSKYAHWLLVACLLLAVNTAAAQQPGATDPSALLSRDGQRALREANKAFAQREFIEAATLYEQVLNEAPNYFWVAYRLGRCYYYSRDYQSEIQWYNTALQLDPNGSDTLYFDLGTALMRNGEYQNAKAMFNTFRQRYRVSDDLKLQSAMRIQGCDFALENANAVPDYRATLITGLNEEGTDFNPTPYILRGDTFMIFTTHRGDNRGRRIYNRLGEEFSDLWIANATSDSTFTEVETIGKRVNTKANDGSATVSPDGLTLYYTICNKGRQRKSHGCSIYRSEFNPDAKAWGRYQLLEGINGEREVVVNSRGKTKKAPTYDAYPALSPDGSTMYFISDRDGGLGSTDIWYSTRIGTAWSTPVHAGRVVNTPFSETSPNVGADGATLYFASDGLPGFGGYDLFRAKGRQAAYEAPENLGRALNSSFNDHGLTWIFQDSIGYIASDRPGGPGRFDIYKVEYIFRPPVELSVTGVVRDVDTREAVPFAIVVLFEEDENGARVPIDTFQTDQTGRYTFQLGEEKNYCMVGNAPEYFANDTCVTTKGIGERVRRNEQLGSNASVNFANNKYVVDLRQDVDILLKHIEIDEPIVLQNIYFDFDSANIRPDAEAALRMLLQILTDNPQITIQMGAHTDTNGSERYNKDLSERRARSVVRYLSQNGIAGDRLSWFGFGESEPLIYPELSAMDEQANRRVEFRVKSISYAPRQATATPTRR